MDQATFVDGVLESQTPPNANGFVTFNITVDGKQYPVRVATKLPAVLEQARTVGIDAARWHYTPSQGKENPNKPGTHYVNRALAKVELLSAAETPQNGTTAPAATGGSKDSLIVRQTVVKALSPAFSGLLAHAPADRVVAESYLLGLAGRLERAVLDGFFNPAAPQDSDDIPF